MDDFRPQQTPPQKPDEPQGFRPTNPDNEPETYVTPEGQPTTLGEAHAEPQAQTVVAPKKSGAKKWVLGGLVVLLLAGLGALAYWQYMESTRLREQIVGMQSTLDASNRSNVKLADELEDLKKDDTNPTAAATSDAELIKAESEAFLSTTEKNTYVYNASNVKTEGSFAIVKSNMPNSTTNPKTIVLEKSKDAWVVIYNVVGPVPAADKDKLTVDYGVPKTLLAE